MARKKKTTTAAITIPVNAGIDSYLMHVQKSPIFEMPGLLLALLFLLVRNRLQGSGKLGRDLMKAGNEFLYRSVHGSH